MFFISAVECNLRFEIDLCDLAHGGLSGACLFGEFDDLTNAIFEVSGLAACEELAEGGVFFTRHLFRAKEVAFEEFDRGFGEGADGTLFVEEAWEELVDMRVYAVACLGLKLSEAVSEAGEFT